MNRILLMAGLTALSIQSMTCQAQEPCHATVVIKGGLFEPASGYYMCTMKAHANKVVTAWTWTDESAMLSRRRYKSKYAFACNERMVKLLERELSGLEDENWQKPQTGTVADKWMNSVCAAARLLN